MNKDLAVSVRARLLNVAKAQGADFNQVLVRFALERVLYRLGLSAHADHFLLKGAFPIGKYGLHRGEFWSITSRTGKRTCHDIHSIISTTGDALRFAHKQIGRTQSQLALAAGVRLLSSYGQILVASQRIQPASTVLTWPLRSVRSNHRAQAGGLLICSLVRSLPRVAIPQSLRF
jgi:hypothetical protein